MRIGLAALFLSLALVPSSARADVPKVVTDVAPVHSLVSMVMDGVGVPDLLLPASASPHDYAFKPSDARRLQDADLVFWIGASLTPWLEAPLETLSGNASRISLLDVEETFLLEFRQGVVFEIDEGDDDHAHDHGDDAHDGHDHASVDPHAWLDPSNGKVWVSSIAAELSRLDPENAAIYSANADAARKSLDDLMKQLSASFENAPELRFVVLHDAYHYFENRHDRHAVGAISASDAVSPGAARVSMIGRAFLENDVTCVFTEAQLPSLLAESLSESSDVKIAQLDPIGIELTPGPGLYGKLLRAMAASFQTCE